MGFLQATITVGVETVNVMIILQSQTTQDIVFNFIAVAIISDFDNFVYNSLRNEPLKQLVNPDTAETFLKVSFTTSPQAKSFKYGGAASDQVDANGDPMCQKIEFWRNRSCTNKLLRLIYKCERIFFVAFYFYFYPAIAVMCIFALPMVFRSE